VSKQVTFVVASLLAIFWITSGGRVLASGRYPIPFDSRADWVGVASQYPSAPSAQLLITYGLKHNIVLAHMSSPKPLNELAAARLAYDLIFVKNTKTTWPAGGVYIVLGVYGPANPEGKMPMFGFVFERSRSGRWQPRHVSRSELEKIESLVLHGPSPSHQPPGRRAPSRSAGVTLAET
jgi:hypothetical protein